MANATTETIDLYVRRLERLESNIGQRLSSIDKAVLAIPTVGLALIGLTQRQDPPEEAEKLAYFSLVVLALGLVLYSVMQMRVVFCYAGLRRAIEEYAESSGLLPKGLFTWERWPALEVSGKRRPALELSGKRWPALEVSGKRRRDKSINPGRYIQPLFLVLLDAGMCIYAVWRLERFGMASFWFIGSCILSVTSVIVILWAFREVPAINCRAYCWASGELADNAGHEQGT